MCYDTVRVNIHISAPTYHHPTRSDRLAHLQAFVFERNAPPQFHPSPDVRCERIILPESPMPRNPNKKQCRKPNCHSFAMRGRDLCRSHLDPVLGPRGAGAPKGNLNSLKNATTSRFNPGELKELTQQIIDDPHHYHRHLLQYLEQVGRPPADPLKSLIVLRAMIETLLPILAENLFTIEANELIQRFPDSARPSVQILIWQGYLSRPPLQRLFEFRKMRNQILAKRKLRDQLAKPTSRSQKQLT